MGTTTAAARRAQAKSAFDVYMATCPTRQVFTRLGEKWAGIVILLLDRRPLRFSGLQREIPSVSQKVLTQTLRALERDGLITREVEATVPPRVTYDLTDLARSMLPVLLEMKRWAEERMPEIERARTAYDGREGATVLGRSA